MMVETVAEKLVIANWKANLSLSQAEKWLGELSEKYSPIPGIQVVLAVPFPFLIPLHTRFKSLPGVSWAAQDVSSYPLGNYTGAVPAAWLNGLVDYALVGHRERRRYFHETIQEVANKSSEAIAEDICPVLCVDLDFARQQAAALETEEMEHLIVAYTPADADHLEVARNVSSVAEGVRQVASLFPECSVLYGGGVNAGNVGELISLPQVSGVMAAGGCLNPLSFLELLNNAAKSLAL
jgi:triosephosphate isomerase